MMVPALCPYCEIDTGGNHQAGCPTRVCSPRVPLLSWSLAPLIRARRFYLYRMTDLSGMSGVGVVAEGVAFAGGQVVLSWLKAPYSLGVYASVEAMREVHGHEGRTTIQWVD